MMDTQLTDLAMRYAAVWNEHDVAQRRQQIEGSLCSLQTPAFP